MRNEPCLTASSFLLRGVPLMGEPAPELDRESEPRIGRDPNSGLKRWD
jgi:hypothetical protein